MLKQTSRTNHSISPGLGMGRRIHKMMLKTSAKDSRQHSQKHSMLKMDTKHCIIMISEIWFQWFQLDILPYMESCRDYKI